MGYMQAGSKFKYLRCITGRHDIPFYYDEEVEIQKSFLDAFLKGQDREGWSVPGKLPPVDICLRVNNPGFNDPKAERAGFPRRQESDWPIARTIYKKFYLTGAKKLSKMQPSHRGVLKYEAPT
jgi:predicted acyl esterase